MFRLLFLAVTCFIFTVGCVDELNNDTLPPYRGVALPYNIEGNLEISDFVWRGLNDYYYWQSNVDKLSDDIFEDPVEYNQFINSNSDPKSFFNSLLSFEDRFSALYEDYRVLENTIQGVSSSYGVEFGLLRSCNNCNDLIGFIKYIYKDTEIENINIKRGDIFIGVNGNRLKVSNYQSLLYGDQETIILNMAKINNGAIVRDDSNIELIREFDFEINPVQIKSILNLDDAQSKSTKKVAYLMYNQFIRDKSEELNDIFGDFRDHDIDELVLDLRYNGGGSIKNCVELASMITGQFVNEVFAQEKWNKKNEDYLIEKFGKEAIVNRFVDTLTSGNQINSLRLNRVFILTSAETASASELLINGLKPYIEVIHIGGQTTGKNVGSITVYDHIDENETKNPNHTYAMQPIVLKISNSEGFSDYPDGLVPDYPLEEELQNLSMLGSSDEPLLSAAISIIQDSIIPSAKSKKNQNKFKLSNLIVTKRQEMYSDKGKLIKKY